MTDLALLANRDPFRAFLPYPETHVPQGHGPLSGKTFAVKDLFDVEGYPTSFGQPHVLARSGLKLKTAPMVQDLLNQGARFVGKTHLVEMAFALTGRNAHFGTPINPRAPDRLPGGSSSGSAAAVAGGLADIGLATDTLGSIRVPASYCGLFGLRPSHGRLSLEGAFPLAPSLDTGGWLTRDAKTLVQVAEVFLPGEPLGKFRLCVPRTLIAHLEPGVAEAFEAFLDQVRVAFGDVRDIPLDPEVIGLWVQTVRIIQGYEAWRAHGDMIERDQPELGPGIRERFSYASSISAEAYEAAVSQKASLKAALIEEIGEAFLILPSAPGPAPLRESSDESLEVHRSALLRQLALSSLFSRPEVSFPALEVDGLPVGLSLMGPEGQDLALCHLAESLFQL